MDKHVRSLLTVGIGQTVGRCLIEDVLESAAEMAAMAVEAETVGVVTVAGQAVTVIRVAMVVKASWAKLAAEARLAVAAEMAGMVGTVNEVVTVRVVTVAVTVKEEIRGSPVRNILIEEEILFVSHMAKVVR